MAHRRMFSKNITTTDAFLDMPQTSQLLYFHLNMEADDDGFVGNVKSVCRIVGTNDDDLKILIAKRFLLTFETGVIVIKHWKIHNYIQKDRYKETKYLEEKNQLLVKENGGYTECIQNVSSLDTQVRLGKSKVRKGEVSILSSKDDGDYIKKLLISKDIRMHIIALYAKEKNVKWDNTEQARSFVTRNLKASTLLKGYDIEKIQKVMEYLKNTADFKWTLETVSKYIDEELNKLLINKVKTIKI